MPSGTESSTLQTTETSMAILDLLAERDGAGITELAERMDRPKSTIHGHLAILEAGDYVVKQGDPYALGPELLRLGHQVRTRKDGYVLAGEYTDRMYEETGFRSVFAVEMGGQAVFTHTASGEKTEWSHEQLGNRLGLHSTALGKAILAEMPRSRVERILDEQGLPRRTRHTVTDREELLAHLERFEEQGYATNHQENIADLYGIGVAATGEAGTVVGGFSITGPKYPFTDPDSERRLATDVMEIVTEYELELSLV